MILYDFRCPNGHRFEAGLPTMSSPDPACRICGATASRLPAAVRLNGSADPGPSREQMPRSWQAVNGADPDTVRGWRKVIERREKLEEKYQDLAGDRRPVLAHEGIFARKPLRLGDDVASSVAEALAATKPGSTPSAPEN